MATRPGCKTRYGGHALVQFSKVQLRLGSRWKLKTTACPLTQQREGRPHRVRHYQGQLTTSTVRVTGAALFPAASVTV
jgi:hypothetical protein